MKSSYVYGFLAFLPIALVMAFAVLVAAATEADNRAATRIRQQISIDKKHLLKVPAINKRNGAKDCQLSDDEIRCITFDRSGEMKIAVSN